MVVRVDKTEKNVVQLEIEVDQEQFEQGMARSFARNAGKFNIPGFRKGKAPRGIVERYYGEQALYEDAVNFIFPEVYQKAIEENDIHPVDKPELDIKQIGSGQNLILAAKVVVKPGVTLGVYKGIKVEKLVRIVSDMDEDAELNRIIDRNARIMSIEDRGVQEKDIAVIDFDGLIDGKPFNGGSGKDYPLTIGSGSFIPGFEEQLKGMTQGSERNINLQFPDEYHEKEFAGKDVEFAVKLKEIKLRQLPDADDEFAKDVSEFDTITAYKADLRKKLEEKALHEAGQKLEDEILNALDNRCEVDIPQVMIEKQIDSYMRDFEMKLGMQYGGLTLEKFLQFTGRDMKTFREQYTEQATFAIKSQLVLEKISQVEGIQAGPEETESEINRLSEGYKQTPDEFKNNLNDEDIEYIKNTIISRKTLEFLTANADTDERHVAAEEYESLLKEKTKAASGGKSDEADI